MRSPLLIALPAALAGFGLWIWLTGPGASVPNALIAFVIAIVCGRLAWTLVAKREPEDAGPGVPPAADDRGGPR